MTKNPCFDFEERFNKENYRATGRTTRLVDEYVQILFKNVLEEDNKYISIHDHYPSRMATRMLIDKIRNRIKNEHNLECEVSNDGTKMRIKDIQPGCETRFIHLEEDGSVLNYIEQKRLNGEIIKKTVLY